MTRRCDGCGRFLADDSEVVQVPIRDTVHPYIADWATYHPECAPEAPPMSAAEGRR